MKPASGDPSVVLIHGHIRQQAAWEPTRILCRNSTAQETINLAFQV